MKIVNFHLCEEMAWVIKRDRPNVDKAIIKFVQCFCTFWFNHFVSTRLGWNMI
jgi:hypothetical protein